MFYSQDELFCSFFYLIWLNIVCCDLWNKGHRNYIIGIIYYVVHKTVAKTFILKHDWPPNFSFKYFHSCHCVLSVSEEFELWENFAMWCLTIFMVIIITQLTMAVMGLIMWLLYREAGCRPAIKQQPSKLTICGIRVSPYLPHWILILLQYLLK